MNAAPENARVNPRVLLLDDQEPVRQAVESQLRYIHCEVSAVGNGRDAELAFREVYLTPDAFDFVMLDITVPNDEGALAMLPRLRAIDPEIRAIVMSGESNHDAMMNPTEFGFSASLAKPITLGTLRLAILKALFDHPSVRWE